MTDITAAANRTMYCQHIVQLFDNQESVADTVAAYAKEGLDAGAAVILVMAAGDWELTATRLKALNIDPGTAAADGGLIVRDSRVTLAGFMRGGWPQPDLFRETIGEEMRQARARNADVRIYGDMVDRLASSGDFNAAAGLEELWNALREELQFALLCGYSAAHFGHPRSTAWLRRICDSHSHVRSSPHDMLGAFLLNQRSQDPSASGSLPAI